MFPENCKALPYIYTHTHRLAGARTRTRALPHICVCAHLCTPAHKFIIFVSTIHLYYGFSGFSISVCPYCFTFTFYFHCVTEPELPLASLLLIGCETNPINLPPWLIWDEPWTMEMNLPRPHQLYFLIVSLPLLYRHTSLTLFSSLYLDLTQNNLGDKLIQSTASLA